MIAVDLFAGLGGFTLSGKLAGCRVAWAANHWPAAVDAHRDNYLHTSHACQDLQQADWTQVPSQELLLTSPACAGHSPARGKCRSHHDAQFRSPRRLPLTAPRPSFDLCPDTGRNRCWRA